MAIPLRVPGLPIVTALISQSTATEKGRNDSISCIKTVFPEAVPHGLHELDFSFLTMALGRARANQPNAACAGMELDEPELFFQDRRAPSFPRDP